jgi:hypothetical protein
MDIEIIIFHTSLPTSRLRITIGGESMSSERWDVVNPTTRTWFKMEVAYIFCK